MNTRRVVATIASLVVVLAAGTFVWSAVSTSSARVSATTGSEGFLTAGTIDLTRPNEQQQFLFDQDGMYPGLVVDGCIDVRYDGSIPATVRLFARPSGGTGLDEYVDLTLELSTDPAGCDGFADPTTLYSGRLSAFWARHTGYENGLTIGADLEQGTAVALRASAELVDDNDAQGRSFEFDVVVEVRP